MLARGRVADWTNEAQHIDNARLDKADRMVANTREGVGFRPVGRRTEPVSGGCCARRAGATSSQFGESCCIGLQGDTRPRRAEAPPTPNGIWLSI
jgi:hypothetical protein